MKQNPFNVRQAITDQILAAMKNSVGKVTLPWHRLDLDRPVNAVSGKTYRGVNILPLWLIAGKQGYLSNQWATFKQWRELGGHVRKGERSALIVYYRDMSKVVENDDGEDETVSWLMARAYRVFNRDQVDGLEPLAIPTQNRVATVEQAERFVRATGANIRIGGGIACYRRSEDRIDMPDKQLFTGTETSDPTLAWYATLLHEITHWAGAGHRLDRPVGKRFGDRAYAFEELVAELGAAFLCADLGMSAEPREDHAHYLKNWISLLEDDNRAFFRAAAQAQAACEFLHGLQATKQAAA